MANRTHIKWKSIVGLLILYIAMWLKWQWIWSLLLMIWVIPDLFSGVTDFVKPVEKNKNPNLVLGNNRNLDNHGLYSFSSLFIPDWKYKYYVNGKFFIMS